VVDATGDRLQVRLDGVRIFDVRDPTHAAGRVGLFCAMNPGARFEEVLVKRPPLEAYALFADSFLKSDISDWSRVDEGTTGGPSNWVVDAGMARETSGIYTRPDDRDTLDKRGTNLVAGDAAWTDVVLTARLESGSDDTLGLLFRYIDSDNCYRFSMDQERGYRRLVRITSGAFALLWEDSFAYTTGRTYEISIVAVGRELRGYMNGVPMFAVQDPMLVAGRIGLYCWANQDARFSNVRVYPPSRLRRNLLLQDSFERETAGRWMFVNQSRGRVQPAWHFMPGELRQIASIYAGSVIAGSIDKPGTLAIAGDTSWTDYRLTVRWISDGDGGIGLIFRYVDESNYYRLSMDHRLRYRRLVKFVEGKPTELWSDQVPYIIGRQYLVTIDAIGSEFTGYLDGVELFRLKDADLAGGCIGLYVWRNTGARFLEVVASRVEWHEHYRFGAERPFPAGTRIRVASGAEVGWHEAEPGLVRRFVAGAGDRGRIHFGDRAVTLRLVDGHRRSFLTEYSPQNVRLIRKRDGTGFFVLPAAPLFSMGEYRFSLTYRRDVGPNNPVLSEAGMTSDEVAWLDVPWSGPIG
jgi:hypothetical protein